MWIFCNCGLGYSDPQPVDLVEERYPSGKDLPEYFETLEARKSVLNERRLDGCPGRAPVRRFWMSVAVMVSSLRRLCREAGWPPG